MQAPKKWVSTLLFENKYTAQTLDLSSLETALGRAVLVRSSWRDVVDFVWGNGMHVSDWSRECGASVFGGGVSPPTGGGTRKMETVDWMKRQVEGRAGGWNWWRWDLKYSARCLQATTYEYFILFILIGKYYNVHEYFIWRCLQDYIIGISLLNLESLLKGYW